MFDEKDNETPVTPEVDTEKSSSPEASPNEDTVQQENTQEKNNDGNTKQPDFVSFVPPPASQNHEEQPQYQQQYQPNQFNPQNGQQYGQYGRQSQQDSYGSQYNRYVNQNHNQNPNINSNNGMYRVPEKDKPLNPAIIITVCILVFALVFGLVVAGYTAGKSGNGGTDATINATSSTVSDTSSDRTTPGGSIAINSVPDASDINNSATTLTGVQISQKITPSIVAVLNYSTTASSGQYAFDDGSTSKLSGLGSGVIIPVNNGDTEHTYILTNQHVVSGATSLAVILYNEDGMTTDNQYEAELIGADATTDLALIRIKVSGLPTVTLADSNDVKPGETVYAIGNPGGLNLACSISSGIVSGVNRDIGSTNFIQTDVAINPGNSGGALVNEYGQVIGIISEKIVTVSNVTAEGLSFAIPTAVVKPIADDLLNHGYVTGRVTLNITCETVSDISAYMNNLPSEVRIRVTEVKSGSSLEQAGLKINDFITAINGTKVMTVDQLAEEREKYSAGDKLTISVYRFSTKETFDITFVLEEDKGS